MTGVVAEAAQVRATSFEPAYEVGVGDASDELQAQRRQVLSVALRSDIAGVDTRLKAQWEEEIKSLPPSVRSCLAAGSEEQYRQHKYFDTLQEVVNERIGANTDIASLTPAYDVGIGKVADEVQAQRRDLISRARQEDHKVVEAMLKAEWGKQVESLSPLIKSCLPSDSEEKYRQDAYFEMLENVINTRLDGPGGAPAVSGSSGTALEAPADVPAVSGSSGTAVEKPPWWRTHVEPLKDTELEQASSNDYSDADNDDENSDEGDIFHIWGLGEGARRSHPVLIPMAVRDLRAYRPSTR